MEEQGDRLSTDELHNLTLILVWSGQDTTARQLGRAMVVFAEHPDQWRQLAERPELVDQAVEEVCRWSPQTRMLWRFAAEDVAYEDLDIPASSMVFLAVVAANRDPRAWGDGADRFDITAARRAINLDFSAGIHLCLGANLARLEMTEGLRALTRRFGPPEVAGDIVWRPPSAAIHGPDALPLRFSPPA